MLHNPSHRPNLSGVMALLRLPLHTRLRPGRRQCNPPAGATFKFDSARTGPLYAQSAIWPLRSLRQIISPCVFLHHPPGVELRNERDHGSTDFLDPLARYPVGIAIEEARNDLLGQRPVQILAIATVLLLDGVGMGIVPDGESVGPVVALPPPTVENAEIEAPMATRLHATGAGCLQGPARIVQPDITPGNHLPPDVHIVVFYENQAAFQLAVFTQVNDVLDEAFPLVVARMRFAGKNELNGPLFVMNQLHDVLKLLKYQRRPLVGGKT